ncbi:MAG: helix-turn-helix transcriptional regulator [Planctomycetota bacterium]
MSPTRRNPQAPWLALLRAQGRTQVWLAAQTGVSFSAVYAYTRGVRNPPDGWYQRAAAALGVPVELILPGERAA